MKNLMKCTAILAAVFLAFGFASCKTNSDDDSGTIAVTSVELNKTSTSIGVGEKETLTATVKPDNATDKSVTWTSSNTDVASVDKGVVTAVAEGTATITAKAGDKTATCTVTVTAARQSGSISYGTASVEKTTASSAFTNELTKTGDGTVTYASSDTGVATVNDSTGVVTIVGEGTATITASVTDSDTYYYAIKTASYTLTVTAVAAKIVDVSTLTEDTVVTDGYTITGTLSQLVQVSIADGATVTLSGVSINADSEFNSSQVTGFPALACLGDATIIIADGTENTLYGIHNPYTGGGAGIYVPSGSTVTVTGNGALTVQGATGAAGIGCNRNDAGGDIVIEGGIITASSRQGAGIGGSAYKDCGSITITGGTITATAGGYNAAIGSGGGHKCGNITISGGTITATGGGNSAGIGGGTLQEVSNGGSSWTKVPSECGTITITSDVTSVTATKGGSLAPYSIGAGYQSTCGTVTIGGDSTTYAAGISESPYTYPPSN